MTDAPQSRPNPAQLAHRLTELEDQLRLASCPAGGSLLPHPALGRLEVAARLLGSLQAQDPDGGWEALARAAGRFCATARAHPDRLSRSWEPGLERVARSLEHALARLDEGQEAPRVAESVPARAWAVGGDDPLTTELLLLRDRLQSWRHGAGSLPEAVLRERAALWREIRDRGDQLLLPALRTATPSSASEQMARAGVQVALLLASPFQRQQLVARLDGLEVRHLDNPAEAVGWLEQRPPRALLLADNLEPSRHLDRTCGALRERPQLRPDRCVLVAGALSAARPHGRRALPPGVDGAWEPPYALEDLAALVARA